MNEKLQSVITELKEHLEFDVSEFKDEVTLVIQPDKIAEVSLLLREKCGLDMLLDETAVDYWPQEALRFQVVYHFYSMKENILLGIRVPLVGLDPHIATIETIFPNANWYEREIWDMFGIHFDGHSDLRRILMPKDWKGFPQRKDYPLGYEEVQFTFDFEEIDVRKPYAKE